MMKRVIDRPLTLGELLGGLAATFDIPVKYQGCGPATLVRDLCIDSRTVESGCAFLAVRGETHDGHEFLADARARGAEVAIIEPGHVLDWPHVLVHDTARAFPFLAANRWGWPQHRLRLAGVTGTNGKTTTAHLVAAMLAASGRRHGRLGTTGNFLVDGETRARFTTPFPHELQELLATITDRGGTDVVMEVSSHALTQGRVRPLRFDAVGLTGFSQDHLDFHGDMGAYLEAKCLLPSAHLKRDGLAVAVVDGQPAAERFLQVAAELGARTLRASRHGDESASIRVMQSRGDARGTTATIASPIGELQIHSPLVGAFNLDNIMIAIGLAIGLELEADAIIAALAVATGAPGRLEAIGNPADGGPRVFVDYAHTPDAVENVLAALRPLCRGRLIVVLGCGGDRDRTKRPKMGAVAARDADRFYATSDNPRTEDPQTILDDMITGVAPDRFAHVVRQPDRASAIRQSIMDAGVDDIVVVAGKGHEDYQILGAETIHFDDREHAAAALLARR